jgi:hypothetical protein
MLQGRTVLLVDVDAMHLLCRVGRLCIPIVGVATISLTKRYQEEKQYKEKKRWVDTLKIGRGSNMIIYKTTMQKVDEILSVACDICKEHYSFDDPEVDEFEFIRRTGGYNSVFGDEYEVELDICQYCLKKLIGGCVDEKGLSRSTVYP